MQDQPDTPPEPRALRQLRIMVTTLTGVMIFGILAVVVLLALRLQRDTGLPPLPASVTLPAGTQALAVTAGPGWYAVVTADNRLLVYDAGSGALRRDISIDAGAE